MKATNVPADESEEQLSRYFQEFQDNRDLGFLFFARRPRQSAQALAALHRLPVVEAQLGDSVEAKAVRRGLENAPRVARAVLGGATSILALPDDAADYTHGAAKQTLRRKVRAAQKQGVHWAEVDSEEKRRELLALANELEREHELEEYRQAEPQNDDLLDCRLWLLAVSADDRPLLLSVTPFDGQWAALRYFRALGSGSEQANARYLMTQVLVEHLVPEGVKYLADTSNPVGLTNGLRHFQRMLGFRMVRVRLNSAALRR